MQKKITYDDTIDEINNVLGLDIDNQFEITIK